MYERYVKRALDVVFSVVSMAVLSPLFLLIAVLIKLDSPGPVIFSQKRYGKDKALFDIYKFRSMRADAPHDVPTNDLRGAGGYITPLGKILRKTSLDELPQLFNILKGDMSFIGPRPELLRYTTRYTPQEQCILWVRPGISDPSSIKLISLDELVGHDDPEAAYEAKILGEKNRMRVEYARSQSFGLDARVFWETLWCVLQKNLKGRAGQGCAAQQGGSK